MAPIAVRFYGDPTARAAGRGDHRHQRQDDDRVPDPPHPRGAGVQTGLLGTVKRVVGGVEEPVERTTPEAIDLQATFRRMVDAGDRACAMEVSSHALALDRVDGVRFAVAAFTNLTQDHLDFHARHGGLLPRQARLFVRAGRAGAAVVNIDDPYGDRLAAELEAAAPLSPSRRRRRARRLARARDLASTPPGRASAASGPDGEVDVALPLPGRFNVENALVRARRLPRARRRAPRPRPRRSPRPAACPGRFEPVDEGQPFAVLVDYAHTPDSLENVLAPPAS